MILVELKNINKYYNIGKGSEVHALKQTNLFVEKGEMISIVGESGAGKSTLLHILAMIDDYTSGKYFFLNQDVNLLSDNQKSKIRNQKIGIVLQAYGLADGFTCIENVMLPLHFGKYMSKKEKTKRALEMLKKVGIEEKAKQNVENISGGQRQRVAIARSLINNPDLILLDEPTGALDSKTSSKLMDLLEELNKEGITIILVTHDKTIAQRCKRIITILDGKIINDEPTQKEIFLTDYSQKQQKEELEIKD